MRSAHINICKHRSDENDKVMRRVLEVLSKIELNIFIESLILAQDERWRRA